MSLGSIRSYETLILVSSFMNGSVIRFPQRNYDNLGNVISESFAEYHLKLPGSTEYYSDLKITKAQISIEYKITVFFEDNLNLSNQNSNVSSVFYNYTSQFINLSGFL